MEVNATSNEEYDKRRIFSGNTDALGCRPRNVPKLVDSKDSAPLEAEPAVQNAATMMVEENHD